MEIHGKKLDDARVARVRARFERDRAKPHRLRKPMLLTFDELLDHFANDCMSFVDIAKIIVEGGMTRERVRQLYMRYFAGLFPTRGNGHKRQKVCTLKRRSVAKRNANMDFSDNELLANVVQRAKSAGCIVYRDVKYFSRGIHATQKTLMVNGLAYAIHSTVDAWQNNHQLHYSLTTISRRILEKREGVIVVRKWEGIENIFIIPSKKILDLRTKAEGTVYIYIPTKRGPACKKYLRRLDWWQYENAWPPPQKEKVVAIPLTQALETSAAGK